MRITDCHLYEYSLRLKQPIGTANAPVLTREGLLITITNESGASAWGEAAPLPGFSVETISEAEAQLVEIVPQLIGKDVSPGVEQLSGGFDHLLGDVKLSASVRCAVEMVILNLLAGGPDAATIPVNGLVGGLDSEVAARISDFIKRGFKTVKLKVGRMDVRSDIDRVRKASTALDGRAVLRLDANRAWSLDDALEFAHGVKGCNIEYIEEPLKDTAQLRELVKEASLLPIALDETLREIEPADLHNMSFVAAVILKPTLLGGFERATHFAREASRFGARVVVTSTFESPIGIAALGSFAAVFGSRNTAAGLETVDWFDQQLLTMPISLEGGVINLSQTASAIETIDYSLLKEIDISRGSHG